MVENLVALMEKADQLSDGFYSCLEELHYTRFVAFFSYWEWSGENLTYPTQLPMPLIFA